MTLVIQVPCWMRPAASIASAMARSRSAYVDLGGEAMVGNRSASMDRKSGTSCATSLDRFMSRSVRYSSISSSAVRLVRLVAPAVRSTDKMLRRPKS